MKWHTQDSTQIHVHTYICSGCWSPTYERWCQSVNKLQIRNHVNTLTVINIYIYISFTDADIKVIFSLGTYIYTM